MKKPEERCQDENTLRQLLADSVRNRPEEDEDEKEDNDEEEKEEKANAKLKTGRSSEKRTSIRQLLVL